MKFASASEGLTDYRVITNLLAGFFADKNIIVNRLIPKDTEPVGWNNLFKYLATDEFQNSFDFNDFIIVQVDTDTSHEWEPRIQNIGADDSQMEAFIQQVEAFLIDKIGQEFYNQKREKIIFAICVHEIECWLLPFNAERPAHNSKIVNCDNTLEQIANKRGFSLNEKNYKNGKYYDQLSKEMTKQKLLMNKFELNPSLKIFINKLQKKFPPQQLEVQPEIPSEDAQQESTNPQN